MTPEREAEIRSMCRRPDLFGVDNAYARRCIGEVLAELDRLRAAADGLKAWLGTRRDETLARSDEMFGEIGSTEYQFHGGSAMAFNEAKLKGRELGLFTDKP